VEKVDELPSCHQSIVLIGCNGRGSWVAQESRGLFGGLFVSRAQAVKYALSENGRHPATLVLSAESVELDMRRKAPVVLPATRRLLSRRIGAARKLLTSRNNHDTSDTLS
jgi:hypothetical protein